MWDNIHNVFLRVTKILTGWWRDCLTGKRVFSVCKTQVQSSAPPQPLPPKKKKKNRGNINALQAQTYFLCICIIYKVDRNMHIRVSEQVLCLFLLPFCGKGDWTQFLVHVRWALCHWAMSQACNYFFIIGELVLCLIILYSTRFINGYIHFQDGNQYNCVRAMLCGSPDSPEGCLVMVLTPTLISMDGVGWTLALSHCVALPLLAARSPHEHSGRKALVHLLKTGI